VLTGSATVESTALSYAQESVGIRSGIDRFRGRNPTLFEAVERDAENRLIPA